VTASCCSFCSHLLKWGGPGCGLPTFCTCLPLSLLLCPRVRVRMPGGINGGGHGESKVRSLKHAWETETDRSAASDILSIIKRSLG